MTCEDDSDAGCTVVAFAAAILSASTLSCYRMSREYSTFEPQHPVPTLWLDGSECLDLLRSISIFLYRLYTDEYLTLTQVVVVDCVFYSTYSHMIQYRGCTSTRVV